MSIITSMNLINLQSWESSETSAPYINKKKKIKGKSNNNEKINPRTSPGTCLTHTLFYDNDFGPVENSLTAPFPLLLFFLFFFLDGV